ncbi:MAG: class I tRNA ligase family protein, partial [Polyangia bacterium]
PLVKCAVHGYQPVPERELPVTLPADVTLAEGGRSPLAAHPTWAKTICPVCGGPAERETDTMDGFVESSWYALRYAAPAWAKDSSGWLDRVELDHWSPVDQYIGGAEHATKHLIYARFFTKMLRDWGWVKPDLDEPFTRLLSQGMVCKETYQCSEHGYLFPDEVTAERACAHCGRPVTVGRVEKMSKSLKNVVEPLPLIEKYGADTVRVFSLFAAPPDSVLEWSEAGVEGAWRFLNRVWRLVIDNQETRIRDDSMESDIRQKTHATIKRVTDDVGGDRFHFNTAISAIMELVNAIYAAPSLDRQEGAGREAVETVVTLLSPIAPHLAEELWHRLGHTELLATRPWPSYDAEAAAKKRIPYPVQVNGKLRGQVEAEPEATQATIEPLARALPTVAAALDGKQLVKIVFVPGRLINFVVK